MALDKNKTVSAIGRRTRLRNHDVQRMFEALIEVWTEELASGGRIEIQNFLVLEVKQVDRGENAVPAAPRREAAPGAAILQSHGGKAQQTTPGQIAGAWLTAPHPHFVLQ
jgi:nucleoid DNA-binding protein